MKNNQLQINILNGWQRVKLGDIGRVSMCKRIFKHETLQSGRIPFYKISTFGKVAGSFIPEDLFNKYKNNYPYPKKGEILISASGTIGRTVVFDGEKSYFQDSNIVWIANSENMVLNKFLRYVYLKTKWISTDGGIISRLYNEDLRSIQFDLPPLSEQKRIVEVLETWDRAIEKIENQIDNRKLIKTSLTQKLLTGKTRLLDFSDEWKSVKLGDVSTMGSGGTPKSNNAGYYGGDIFWVSIADMTKNGKYLLNTEKKLTKEGLDNSSARLYPAGTILYAMYASIGECSIAGAEMSSSQAILGIKTSDQLNNLFLYHYLSFIKEKTKLQGQQGAQSNLNAGMVRKFALRLPPIGEQLAIVEILDVADGIIDSLVKKLRILKYQKKYLLNNLITGKIRTPENLNMRD